jgi:TonB-dependent SusC/RagA subfamily outer membrane receptor
MSKKKRLKYCLLLLAVVVLFLGLADEDTRIVRIREALINYNVNHPQQKAYLHLDRPYYHAGEDLWFKAYLVDGMFHVPDSFSTNLYVELISPAKTQVEIKRIRMTYGFGYGDFRLSDTLPEGLYQIRAYTNWMQNFHPDFFFSKNIQIINSEYKKIISPKQARKNLKHLNTKENVFDDLDVQFFPEGGDLVTGLESVVAFKAVNKSGDGVSIQGSLYDSDKNRLAEFNALHDGMGKFTFVPQKGKKYYTLVTNTQKEYRFNLPEPLNYGIVMGIENQKNEILLRIHSNKPPISDRVANEVIIIGQVRGKIYYQSVENLADGSATVTVSKNLFPSGIVQFTLFSGRMIPIAERLVFVNHDDFMRIRLQAYDTLTDNNERLISLNIVTQDSHSRPLKSNLSVAVLYDSKEEVVNPDNIVSNLLLTSDLRGFIKNPGYYLQNASPGNPENTDLLMLTHGWRKFNWTEIMKNDLPELKYFEEKGITIAGKITTELFGIPLKNCKVQLSVAEEYNDVFSQLTNEKGIFKFEKLVYYDTLNMELEAWRPSGRKNLVILLPDDEFAPITKLQGDYTLTTVSERDNKAYRKEKYRKEKIALEEEQKRIAREDSNKLKGIYGEPDAVIRSEDFPSGYRDALQVLQGRVPGVMVNGNNVIIRGINTIYGNSQPLYLIDGVPTMDVSAVLSIPVEDIDRIEILKGPSSAIYGSRGGNGVIAIYTKRGTFMKKGVLEFQMLGYYWPRKFYQPRFEANAEPSEIETIIWEPIIETDVSGKARIIFRKPNMQGNFRIIIEGVSFTGEAGYANLVLENN